MTDTFNSEFADNVAKLYYKKFNELPKTGKPIEGKEWTLLAGILKHENRNGELEIISLATGSKCIGPCEMSLDGTVLNDCHAEVLARRGFVRYLYHQIDLAKSVDVDSSIFGLLSQESNDDDNDNKSISRKYRLRNGITFHLFTTHVPCGDASIFLTSSDADDEVANEPRLKRKLSSDTSDVDVKTMKCDDGRRKSEPDINRTGAKCLPDGAVKDAKLPGIDYHVIGVVRTKPGRGDRTLSMSCSDKIAKWNCLGLQGCLLTILIEPIYLASIIVASHQYSEDSLYRAVLSRVHNNLPNNVSPLLLHTNELFAFSRSADTRPASAAIIWCAVPYKNREVYVRGRKLGWTKKSEMIGVSEMISKKMLPIVCKKMFLTYFRELFGPSFDDDFKSYLDIKRLSAGYLLRWSNLKKTLGGWSEKPIEHSQFI